MGGKGEGTREGSKWVGMVNSSLESPEIYMPGKSEELAFRISFRWSNFHRTFC